MLPAIGPCQPYVSHDELVACCPALRDVQPPLFAADTEQVRMAASELLFVLLGRQFVGLCEFRDVICRPCECECAPCCCWVDRVKLSRSDVVEVVSVEIDCECVDPAEYCVDGGRWLALLADPVTGAPRRWPSCGRLDEVDPDFVVTYTAGKPVPVSVMMAARALACEMSKACLGQECALPSRVRSVSRNGVSLEFASAGELVAADLTGIPEVDLVLQAFNPGHIRRRATVRSRDVGYAAHRLGPSL